MSKFICKAYCFGNLALISISDVALGCHHLRNTAYLQNTVSLFVAVVYIPKESYSFYTVEVQKYRLEWWTCPGKPTVQATSLTQD